MSHLKMVDSSLKTQNEEREMPSKGFKVLPYSKQLEAVGKRQTTRKDRMKLATLMLR